jgi:hypothetical protein
MIGPYWEQPFTNSRAASPTRLEANFLLIGFESRGLFLTLPSGIGWSILIDNINVISLTLNFLGKINFLEKSFQKPGTAPKIQNCAKNPELPYTTLFP